MRRRYERDMPNRKVNDVENGKGQCMDYITEQIPVRNVDLRTGLKIIGDSVDFGKAPVPRTPPSQDVKKQAEQAYKNWGIH